MEPLPSLRQVFEEEESPLLRYAYSFVGQRETAEDLVQEAFLKLHAHWHTIENPRAWLYRAIRNLCLNHLRDHRRETSLSEPDESPASLEEPTQVLGKWETVGILRLLLSELPEQERQLIHLKYHEGLKYEQISQHTGLNAGTVGYKLHHLLKGLAESLRRLGIDSPEG